jgi:hypothetical protein
MGPCLARDPGVSPDHSLAAIVASSDDAIIGKTLDSIIMSWNRRSPRRHLRDRGAGLARGGGDRAGDVWGEREIGSPLWASRVATGTASCKRLIQSFGARALRSAVWVAAYRHSNAA